MRNIMRFSTFIKESSDIHDLGFLAKTIKDLLVDDTYNCEMRFEEDKIVVSNDDVTVEIFDNDTPSDLYYLNIIEDGIKRDSSGDMVEGDKLASPNKEDDEYDSNEIPTESILMILSIYFQRVNEELKSSTYKSAADKISALGRGKRSGDYAFRTSALSNMADKAAARELKETWENKVSEYEGKQPVRVFFKDGNRGVNISAYLVIEYSDFYNDDGHANINFSIGFIPAKLEDYNKLLALYNKLGLSNIMSNGIIWSLTSGINIELKNNMFKIKGFWYEDDVLEVDFNGISDVKRLKNTLVKVLSDTYYDTITNDVLIESGISSDFGLSMDDIIDYVKNIDANSLLK